MTRKIPDWLNEHIDALLGERSTSSTAREAETDEQAHLIKAARRIKRLAAGNEPQPSAEFLARLEDQMREALADSMPRVSPGVTRVPFWNLSWFRPVAGVVSAAAVLFLAVLLLRSVPVAFAPAAPATSALREQAKAPSSAPTPSPAQQEFAQAPAAAPSPAPEAGAPVPATAEKGADAGQDTTAAARPAATPAPAAPATVLRSLPELVAQAQTIMVGRVVAASPVAPPPPGASASAPLRVTFSVERYLKGPVPTGQAVLLTGVPPPPGPVFVPGQRVLVMAGSPDRNGDLPLLPGAQTVYLLTPDGQAVDASGALRSEAGTLLTESELIARIEAILRGQ